jgi:hypothetical protein
MLLLFGGWFILPFVVIQGQFGGRKLGAFIGELKVRR